MAVKVTPVITHRCDLEYREGRSDKVYHIWIENVGANHTVKFRYGRRGSTLTDGVKTGPTHAKAAQEAYLKVLTEKLGKGYKEMPKGKTKPISSTPSTPPVTPGPIKKSVAGAPAIKVEMTLGGQGVTPQLLNAIDEKRLLELVKDDHHFMQEKHDGNRMMIFKNSKGLLIAYNKLGKVIKPPAEYCSVLQNNDFIFLIDGEACGPVFYVFDILQLQTTDCKDMAYEERLSLLGMLIRSLGDQDTVQMVYTAMTTLQKKNLVRAIKEAGKEGVVAKDKRTVYKSGRPASGGPALKFKFVETVSCQVTKVNDKRSVMLMLDKGVHVGSVAIPVNHEIPKAGDIVEVQYLYAYKGGSLYQPVYKGKRDDADKPDSISVLKYKPEE
jgi:bifunctional non-homologous end joining protein LigD